MSRPMKRLALLPLLALAPLGCESGEDQERFRADLSGNNEIPARTTPASGTADFVVNADNTIAFTVDVNNIQNVFAAHIHGPSDPSNPTNAPVIVDLFTTSPPRAGSFTGRLAESTLANTNPNQQVSLDSLLVLMRNGRAYVNVHTNDMAGSPNTGPGDFPAGEIRGQIMMVP